MECDGFVVETLMNIRTAKAGWRIYEVTSAVTTYLHRVVQGDQPGMTVSVEPVDVSGQPTSYAHPRLKGTSSLRAIKDGWRIPRITGAEVKADAEVESL